jgi:hypothetical protein
MGSLKQDKLVNFTVNSVCNKKKERKEGRNKEECLFCKNVF